MDLIFDQSQVIMTLSIPSSFLVGMHADAPDKESAKIVYQPKLIYHALSSLYE